MPPLADPAAGSAPPEGVRAFVLAAGRGERLRPITDRLPKPLLPLLGIPVLGHILHRLVKLGIRRIGVNTHHLADMISDWIAACPHAERVSVLHEPELLGTGGGIRNALVTLCPAGEDLLVHNGDIVSDLELDGLLRAHREGSALVTLGVHDGPVRTLVVDDRGLLRDIASAPAPGCLGFTGIAVYRAEFLRFLPEGPSHVVTAWLEAIRQGRSIATVPLTGTHWTDVGQVKDYAREVARRLDLRGQRVFVAEESTDCAHVQTRGRIVVEGKIHLPENCSIEESILLPGARLLPGQRVERAVVIGDTIVPIGEEGPRDTGGATRVVDGWAVLGDWVASNRAEGDPEPWITRVGLGGSSRCYYRVKSGSNTVIACVFPPGDGDAGRFVSLAEVFVSGGIRVPRILASDVPGGRMLLEDLGDRSVYEWLNCNPDPGRVIGVYQRILEQVAGLHPLGGSPAAASVADRRFDQEHFLWESGYFLEQFVGRYLPDYCGAVCEGELGREREDLARAAGKGPLSLLHRDLQSQNIMLVGPDLEPAFIDFQGARLGPAAYDLASLLWDPYAPLSQGTRELLLGYYLKTASVLDPSFAADSFLQVLLPCRLQRHLQALGAYGFLSHVRGFSWFERFIPEGLRLLIEDCEPASSRWPVLADLAQRCARAFSPRFPMGG